MGRVLQLNFACKEMGITRGPSPHPLDTGPVSEYGVTFLRRYDVCSRDRSR